MGQNKSGLQGDLLKKHPCSHGGWREFYATLDPQDTGIPEA